MNLLLVVDNYTSVSGASVTYVKQPDRLTYSNECELSSSLHQEIVRLAVTMYLQDRFKISQEKK